MRIFKLNVDVHIVVPDDIDPIRAAMVVGEAAVEMLPPIAAWRFTAEPKEISESDFRTDAMSSILDGNATLVGGEPDPASMARLN